MAAVFDIAEMKQRVAATGSKLSAAAQAKQERSAHLLEVLESVETTLAHNQEHIRRLEEEQGRTREAFQQLRNVLHDLHDGQASLFWRCFYPNSIAARADLIKRLDALTSKMRSDGETVAKRGGAQEPDTALACDRPGKLVAVLGLIGSLIAVTFLGFFRLIGSLIAMALFTYKVNSSMPFHLISRPK